MTLRQYATTLRRQWYVILLIASIALALDAAYTLRQPATYKSSVQLFALTSNTETDAQQLSQGSTFTQQRVKTYADILTSPLVLNKVIAAQRLDLTASQLGKKIDVENPLNTVLLNVTVIDTSPQRAAAIANSIGEVFPDFAESIETPEGSTVSPVRISVTRPATVNTTAIGPNIKFNLMLGGLLGLLLGVGAAVLREQLNTSVTAVADIEAITSAVPLGVVPFDKGASAQTLVDVGDQTGRAEAYRTLRTNLQFTNVDNPPRIIVVSSSLPGEGKSTTSCNLALALSLSGASVALVEGDLRKPALSKYLGISSAAGLTNVLAGQYELREVLVPFSQHNLAVLPSGPKPPNPSELLGSEHMAEMISTLGNHFDYVVIDAPPLLPVTDAAVLAAMADGAMLVVRYGKTTKENLNRAVQAISAVNARLLGTVMNFAPTRRRGGGYEGYGYGYGYGTPADAKQLDVRPSSQAGMPGWDAAPAAAPWPEPQAQAQNGYANGTNGYAHGSNGYPQQPSPDATAPVAINGGRNGSPDKGGAGDQRRGAGSGRKG